MNELLKRLKGYQVKVSNILMFTEDSLGRKGILNSVVQNGRVSSFQPISKQSIEKLIKWNDTKEIYQYENMIGIFPDGTRYYSPVGSFAGAVFVYPPRKITLAVKDEDKIHNVEYDFPYVVSVVNKYGRFYTFFAYEKVDNDTKMFQPMLPNFSRDGSACLGTVKLPKIEETTPIKMHTAVLNALFNSIYTNHYNHEIFSRMVKFKRNLGYGKNAKKKPFVGHMNGRFKEVINHILRNDGKGLFE